MFLGIDLGTSSVKAVVIDDAGQLIDAKEASLQISIPHALWSEQAPADWWSGVNDAVLALPSNVRHEVKAIGLSGQMHGATLLDKSGRILRPAILWNDGRSASQCATLQKSSADFVSRTGNLVMPGFTAPKLLWVKENEPNIFDRISKVLLPKDYIRYCLTGEFASDVSDAAGTLWLDVATRSWSPELVQACGLSVDVLPQLFEGPDPTGTLISSVASRWRMAQVPIIAGGGDNAAGAIGAGVTSQGEAMLSLGTSGVIFVAMDKFHQNAASSVHAFCHALPERWHLMSVMLSAASSLEWGCALTGISEPSELIGLAESQASEKSNLIFLPYLSGERTPHNNPFATGVIFGATHGSGKAELAQAILEGVAFGLADGLDAILSAEIELETISVIGGGAKSTYWGKILAAVFQRPLIYRDGATTGPAFGAARLARFSELGGDWKDAFTAPPIIETVDPDDALWERLNAKRIKFQSLCKALENEFKGE